MSKASHHPASAGQPDDTFIAAEIAEIVENLHRHNLNASEEAIAIERLKELSALRSAEMIEAEQEAKRKAAEYKAAREAELAKERGLSVRNLTDKKKRSRPKKAGSLRDIADQHGVSYDTVQKAEKRTEKIGVPMLERTAKLTQFDKPAALDALASMDDDAREATVSAAERGEIAEIVENLHRQDLSASERAIAIERLSILDKQLAEDRAAAEAKAREGKSGENSPTIPSKTKPKKGTGVGRGKNQKKGHKPGSTRAMADQFGINKDTAARAAKQAEALGTETLQRTAKLPAFDKPSSLDAPISMDADAREETIAAAERGEKVVVYSLARR